MILEIALLLSSVAADPCAAIQHEIASTLPMLEEVTTHVEDTRLRVLEIDETLEVTDDEARSVELTRRRQILVGELMQSTDRERKLVERLEGLESRLDRECR